MRETRERRGGERDKEGDRVWRSRDDIEWREGVESEIEMK